MMTFDWNDLGQAIATNSIKPVIIRELDEYGQDFALDMPEGDLYNDFPINNQWFGSFDEAKRWAETYVGMKMNFTMEYVA